MKLDEIRAEAKTANAARLSTLVIALCDHIANMHASFKVIGLESKIGLKDDVHIADRADWPGDW